MHRPSLVLTAALAAAAAAAPTMSAVAQQSQLSLSPFMSVLPSGGASPLAGLAMTIGGTQSGFALRASGNLALQNSNVDLFNSGETYRPWGADADAMFFLAGRGSSRRTIAPYVFSGIGTASTDTDGFADRQTNWSYGAGLQVPLGGTVDLFGESRWRMSQFVLPTARDAFSPTTELRFGLTFHLGGTTVGSSSRR